MAEKGYYPPGGSAPPAGYPPGLPEGYPQGPPAGYPQPPPSYEASVTGGAGKLEIFNLKCNMQMLILHKVNKQNP